MKPAKRAVMAAYRPKDDTVALFVEDGERGHGSAILSVGEARAIHSALGLALRLAGHRSDPLGAVQ